MPRAASVRSLLTFSAAGVVLIAGATLTARTASAATWLMPDGSVRYDYGLRPTPVLVCKPKYVCDIALDDGENILNMAIGDAAHWVVAVGKSGPGGTTPHVFVKPTRLVLETNLLITTTKRVYDVTLRSADGPHPHICFFYADEAAAAKASIAAHEKAAIEAALTGTPLVAPDRVDANYKITGDASVLPEKVFNDGVRTFVEWKALPNALPAVVEIANGQAVPANFRVVGSSYIIDRVAVRFDLLIAADPARRGGPERRASIRHQ